MARGRVGQERRRQIVQGLMKVMAERGYERASIQAIAQEAGLTTGLVHYYFKNKQDILIALVDSLAQLLETRKSTHQKHAPPDAWAQLNAYLEACVGLGPGADLAAVACWVTIGSEAIRLPEVREAYQRVLQRSFEELQTYLHPVFLEEKRSAQNLPAIASALLASVEGIFQLAIAAPNLTPQGFALPTLQQMVRGMVQVQPLATTDSIEGG